MGPGRHGDVGVYAISVVTELTGIEAHTLRAYERAGLLVPARSSGGTRRYSDDDLGLLRRIRELADAGLNVAGIHHALTLEAEVGRLRAENARLRELLDRQP